MTLSTVLSFSLWEKVAEGRMRDSTTTDARLTNGSLTPTLSLRERERTLTTTNSGQTASHNKMFDFVAVLLTSS